MAKATLRGDEIMLFDSKGHSIGYGTSHTLTLSGETAESSSKDSGVFGSQTLTKVTWEIQASHLFTTEEFNALFDAMTKREKVLVYFGTRAKADAKGDDTKTVSEDDYKFWGLSANGETIPSDCEKVGDEHVATYENVANSAVDKSNPNAYYGWAYITSLTANAANGEDASFDATFTGSGKIARCVA